MPSFHQSWNHLFYLSNPLLPVKVQGPPVVMQKVDNITDSVASHLAQIKVSNHNFAFTLMMYLNKFGLCVIDKYE